MIPTKTLLASPEVLEVISRMTFDETHSGIVGKLPQGQLDRGLYESVNKFLEAMGGKWNRKLGGHLFALDPREKWAGLVDGGKLEVKKDGYFPTPKQVAVKMAAHADLYNYSIVLEPSAGTGHIADVVKPMVSQVHVIEQDEQRRGVLKDKGYKVVGTDFLIFNEKYRRILLNPPFENGQDVEHVEHAFDLLQEGGICVAIMAESVFFRDDSKYKNFRDDILDQYGYAEALPKGAFKNSGTMVNARMVVLKK